MAIILHLIQNRPFRWIVAIGWTAFMTIMLVQPENQQIISTGIPPAPPSFERELIFTTGHLVGFSVTCAVWFWAWFGHLSFVNSLVVSITATVVFGSITEYLQGYSPERSPSLFDFLANCVGALFIAFIIWKKQSDVTRLNTQV